MSAVIQEGAVGRGKEQRVDFAVACLLGTEIRVGTDAPYAELRSTVPLRSISLRKPKVHRAQKRPIGSGSAGTRPAGFSRHARNFPIERAELVRAGHGVGMRW